MHLSQRQRVAAAAIVAIAAAFAGWHVLHDHRGTPPPASAVGAGTQAPSPSTSSPPSAARPGAHVTRPSASVALRATPLPAPDTPLATIYDELAGRGAAGDAAAASRLYRDVADRAAHPTADDVKAHDERLAGLRQKLEQARQQAAQCDGLSTEQLQLAPAALTAARLGDKTASDCYVAGFMLYMGGLLDHPEWLAEYKDNALAIANHSLAAGDWTMVGELQRAYSPTGFRIGPLADLVGEDAAMSYRLLRLQRLGMTNAQAAEGFDRMIASAARDLPSDAITQGDAWAHDTFSRYFSNSPPEADDHDTGCRM
jgi:hypothetical protein